MVLCFTVDDIGKLCLFVCKLTNNAGIIEMKIVWATKLYSSIAETTHETKFEVLGET